MKNHLNLLLLFPAFLLLSQITPLIKASNEDVNTCAEEARSTPIVFLKKERLLVTEAAFTKHAKSSKQQEIFYLNKEKHVMYVTNFLNKTMIGDILEFCSDRFVPSNIRGTAGDEFTMSSIRTSESCLLVPAIAYQSNTKYLSLLQQTPLPPNIAKIVREVDLSLDIGSRAADIINLDARTVEALQVVRYTTPDAYYKLHHDHGGYYGKNTENRPWTMLIFLNDLSEDEGGRTVFPELNLEVIPTEGDALIWPNIIVDDHEAGYRVAIVDEDMVHMGMPPSKENVKKYAINLWFGEETFEERAHTSGSWIHGSKNKK